MAPDTEARPETAPVEEDEERRRWISPREVLLAVVVQSVLAVFTTWPLVRYLPSRAPGDLGDPLQSAWIFGWEIHQVTRAPLRLFDAPMYHPEGLSLAFTENMLGLSLPLAPLYWLTHNSLLLQNTILLTTLVVAGVGAYLLLRYLRVPPSMAFASATAFAVMPYRLSQIGHPHIWATHLLPLVLLLLLMCSERDVPRPVVLRRVGLLAVVVAWQAWASLTGGVLVGLLAVAWGVWMLCRGRAALPGLLRGTIGVTLGVLLAVPVMLPYVKARENHPDFGHLRDAVMGFSATPGAYLDSGANSRFSADLYEDIGGRYRSKQLYWEKRLFPGAWLALGGIACLPLLLLTRRRGVAVPLLGLGVGFMGFLWSMGPRYGARADGIPLPFALLERLNGGLTRVPARMGILVPLGLAVFVGVVLGRLPSRVRTALLAVFVALLVFERYPPFIGYAQPPEITDAHRAVAGREGAVVALPVYEYNEQGTYIPGPLYDSQHLYLSTAHYRPMLNGYGSYYPPSYWEAVQAMQRFPTNESLTFLARRGVQTVIVQTAQVKGTRWAGVVQALDRWPEVRRVASSEGVVVFDIDKAGRTAAAATAAASAATPPLTARSGGGKSAL